MPSPTIPSVHNIGAPLVAAMVSAESELAMGSEAETDDFLARRRWPISCMGM